MPCRKSTSELNANQSVYSTENGKLSLVFHNSILTLCPLLLKQTSAVLLLHNRDALFIVASLLCVWQAAVARSSRISCYVLKAHYFKAKRL